MIFNSRRVAFALLWVLNHIPFYRNKFEVETITIELDPTNPEAQWTPEQRLQLLDLLGEDSE